MPTTLYSTPTWDAELIALRDEIYAEQRAIRGDFTLQDAARCAIAALVDIEGYAAGWDAAATVERVAVITRKAA